MLLKRLTSLHFAVTNAVYEDCQTPPPVDHAKAELITDLEHLTNTAIYSCSAGYVINGPNQLVCNVKTEEWQGEPPTCVKDKGKCLKRLED